MLQQLLPLIEMLVVPLSVVRTISFQLPLWTLNPVMGLGVLRQMRIMHLHPVTRPLCVLIAVDHKGSYRQLR
jgi:hypothetical protein